MNMISRGKFSAFGSRFLGLALLLAGGSTMAQSVALDGVSPIPLTTSATMSAVSVDISSGNVIVKSSAGNYSSCSAGTSNTPIINSFTASSATVAPGASMTLTWSSSNTISCNPAQGSGSTWPNLGSLPTSGSRTFNAPTSLGAKDFQLTCTNGTTTVLQSLTVTVSSGGGGGTCTPQYPVANPATYERIFDTFPGYGARRRISVPWNGYNSYSFVATSVPGQFGSWDTAGYPGDGDGVSLISISREPGCFDATKLGANCLAGPARFNSIGWANGSSAFSCQLTAGVTYYINLTFGASTVGPGPHCPIGPVTYCGVDALMLQQD